MATLKDIARQSDCDVSTVSRVLNDRPCRVSDEVRARIRQTAETLGYVANRNASSLVSGRTRVIGVLVANVFDGVFAEYIEALDIECQKRGYALRPFICHNRVEKESVALDSLLHHEVDAMISLFHNRDCAAQYERVRQHGRVLVFRNLASDPVGEFDRVQLDIEEGYHALATHLFRRGCRRIGVVGGGIAGLLARNGTGPTLDRLKCAFRDAGLPPPAAGNAVVCGDSQEEAHAALLERLRRERDCFDGLLVHNINKVFGSAKAVRDAGLRIPHDIKIATISDLPLCRVATEPLTVWAQPIAEICNALAELTFRRLRDPSAPIRTMNIKSELLIRESTGVET